MTSLRQHARALVAVARVRLTRRMLAHRVRARHPTLRCDPTAIWDYGYDDLDALEIGEGVSVGAFAEIVVFKRTTASPREGRLILGDGAVLSTGANVRAAGGVIRIGRGSAISQHCIVVAANHRLAVGLPYIHAPWDDTRTGVDVGDNVWVGAGCVLLPGCRVGDGAVIAAGSVVTGEIPPNEIWGGVPARKLRDVPTGASRGAGAHGAPTDAQPCDGAERSPPLVGR